MRPYHCRHCGGNIYVERFREPHQPVLVRFLCLQCSRQQDDYLRPEDLVGLGAAVPATVMILQGRATFCWENDLPDAEDAA